MYSVLVAEVLTGPAMAGGRRHMYLTIKAFIKV